MLANHTSISTVSLNISKFSLVFVVFIIQDLSYYKINLRLETQTVTFNVLVTEEPF